MNCPQQFATAVGISPTPVIPVLNREGGRVGRLWRAAHAKMNGPQQFATAAEIVIGFVTHSEA
ncbi:MAG: hypothetical protein D6730_07420 [Bacteroidetes bacterium]|nr:MAG: hypothetical protein D6730_07420 [Bacteroidota bacterium]